MAKNQQPLEPLFKDLDKFIQDGEYEKAIKFCDKILALQADDPDAIICKVVGNIKLSQFQEALSVIGAYPKLQNDLLFEKAYCFYRTKKISEALDLLKGVPKPKPPRVLELEAQICYRLEDYKQCISLYEELINQHKLDSPELKTNLCAAYIEAGMIKESQALISRNKALLQETFEFDFNAACAFIAAGDYKTAATHLNTAKGVCTDSLTEDGYSPEEIQDELSVILVQLAYCLQMVNSEEEAMTIYNDVLKTKPSDVAAIAVASNNLVSLKKTREVFDSLKKLKAATSESVEQKLSSTQRKVIGFNKCLLTLHMNKPDQAKELLDQLRKQFPEQAGDKGDEGFTLILASILLKEKKTADAENLLAEYSKRQPQAVRAPFSLAQIYLTRDDVPKAISTLEALSDPLRHKPGVIATLVALYEKISNVEGAIGTLDEYVSWYERQKNSDEASEEIYHKVVTANGNFKMKHKKYEQAAEMFEKLVKKNRNDLSSLPSLIIAASHFDPALAEKYEARLPSVGVEKDVDVDALENLSAPKLAANNQNPQATGGVQGEPRKKTDAEIKKNRKKKKKKILPKNYDPNVQPDPERWLPKWDRSAYKNSKRAKEREKLGKGSQGVSSAANANVTTTATVNVTYTPSLSAQEKEKEPQLVKPGGDGKAKPKVKKGGRR